MIKFSIKTSPIEKQLKSTVVVGIYEDGTLTKSAADLDKHLNGALHNLIKQGHIDGKLGQITPLFDLKTASHIQALIIGCGKQNELKLQGFRKIAIAMANAFNLQKIQQATIYLLDLKVKDATSLQLIRQLTEGLNDGLYKFDLFKSNKEKEKKSKDIIIHIDSSENLKKAEIALNESQAIANAVILTKNLGNLPSNVCTPTFLADQAQDLAKQYSSISVNILEEKDMQKLGMGAILAVAQGSAEDAKLICLEYKGTQKKNPPIALVGKGITFDTGGNSIKPADSMVGMKYDMCGAASVLGTFKAVADLNLPINLVGLIPAVENMPGGSAYKPEDILTSMSGQTIEVISTDAEGRLVLADALTYCERFNPEVVIDIATLTGAVVIALGFHATGLVSNDDALAEELLKAGIQSNDRAWQLPLWDEYQELIKSPFADMANTGGRSAGAITAGCFLSRFTKQFKWVHLDVAGTAAMMMGTTDRMATGRPVPLLTQFLINRVHHDKS